MRVLIVVGSIVAGVEIAMLPAGAAPAWSVVAASPAPPNGHLASVSCVTPTNCFAVGQYRIGFVTKTLAEHWDGASRTVVPSPTQTGLSGVSCPTTTSCFAVGDYKGGLGRVPLIERYG